MLFVWAPAAHAAFPGQNGKIVFGFASLFTINPDGSARAPLFADTSNDNERTAAWSPSGDRLALTRDRYAGTFLNELGLFLINADGTGLHRVPNTPLDATTPAWSPDGQWIVYASAKNDTSAPIHDDLYAIRPSGVDDTRLTNVEGGNIEPAWSPDGAKIAFTSNRDGNPEIYVMNANGSGQTRLTNTTSRETDPNWSPSGSRIAFTERPTGFELPRIWTMNPDGTGMTPITDVSQRLTEPAWSPDGSRIAAMSDTSSDTAADDLFTMNPDGSGLTMLTNDLSSDANPDWQPLPTPYPRPKGATPLRVTLVPAYRFCSAPNHTHGPPLAFGSCNPPAQESAQLTVGTSDANGAAPNMTGFVRYDTIVGNPTTPADEADLALRVEITDVRVQGTLADYTGEVEAQAQARMTDHEGAITATAQDVRFPLTTQCSATAATDIGSTCSLTTTLDTLIPGAVVERARTILQLGQVRVVDGGPDGDTATEPNTVFLRQGVFVP